jgi:hypothetical protein
MRHKKENREMVENAGDRRDLLAGCVKLVHYILAQNLKLRMLNLGQLQSVKRVQTARKHV